MTLLSNSRSLPRTPLFVNHDCENHATTYEYYEYYDYTCCDCIGTCIWYYMRRLQSQKELLWA